jgi:tRNA (guanosine-2'-O-)-methyltransferase
MGEKLAFLFGNEEKGLSEYAFNEADACLSLPMYGFTQSYNLSVSVAITFSHVIERLRVSKVKWKLSEKEKRDLKLSWYKKSVRAGKMIEKAFIKSR